MTSDETAGDRNDARFQVALQPDSALPYGARASMEVASCMLKDETGGNAIEAQARLVGDVVEVVARSSAAVAYTSCVLTFRHAFTFDEQVLLNGYQSWTTTVEKSPWERMRGLRGVSRKLVDKYSLDGGGDYRFTQYSMRRGIQHGWTYATFRREEGAVLIGSLDETDGFTLVIVDASNGTVTLDKELPIRPLPEGEETVVARFAVTRGTVDQCYDRWFELMCVQPRTRDVLTGYTSWYRHYNDIDEAKLASDLRGLRDVFAADQVVSATAQPTLAQDTGIRNVRRLFQIDDGYCKVGDWLTLDKQKFPHGLKPLVKSAHEAGFMAGLWVSPFVCERDSQLFVEHNDWLLRDEGGHAVHAGCHWSGAFALDTRNPEVRTYVLEVLQTITQEWGFDLLKVDFLYAACSLAHDGLNRGQLMADALDLVRTGAGDDCLLLGCGVPLGSAFGKVDFCRIGCDVGLDWDDKPFMRVLHRERVSTKNSLANTYGRAWLDRRAFGNDPDVFFLRKDVKMTEDQKNALLFADATMGSVLLTSDDMSQWDSSAKARFRLALEQLVMPRA